MNPVEFAEDLREIMDGVLRRLNERQEHSLTEAEFDLKQATQKFIRNSYKEFYKMISNEE